MVFSFHLGAEAKRQKGFLPATQVFYRPMALRTTVPSPWRSLSTKAVGRLFAGTLSTR